MSPCDKQAGTLYQVWTKHAKCCLVRALSKCTSNYTISTVTILSHSPSRRLLEMWNLTDPLCSGPCRTLSRPFAETNTTRLCPHSLASNKCICTKGMLWQHISMFLNYMWILGNWFTDRNHVVFIYFTISFNLFQVICVEQTISTLLWSQHNKQKI